MPLPSKTTDANIQVKCDKSSLTFTSDEYEVYNIIERDIYCDLHIIACNAFDRKLLIPVDKKIMIQRLPYFEKMFREGSNWMEGKDSETSSDAGVTKITLKNIMQPKVFAEYLKSLYTGSLKITESNCHNLYRIADYLEDGTYLSEIEKFIMRNLNLSIALKLFEFSPKFDQQITVLFKPYMILEINCSQRSIFNLCDMNKFTRMMNAFASNITPKLFIELIIRKVGDYCSWIDDIDKIDFEHIPISRRVELFNQLFDKFRDEDQKDNIYCHLLGELNSDDYENKINQPQSNPDQKIPYIINAPQVVKNPPPKNNRNNTSWRR